MTKLGNWIRDRLKETDRTREDLAKAMGISPATLDGIIGGEIARPPDARLSAVAKFFGVSADTVRSMISGKTLKEGGDIVQGGRPGDPTATATHRVRLLAATLFCDDPIDAPADGTTRVLLVPDGHTRLKDGTEILVDAEGAASVIAAFNQHGVNLPIDRNHATVLKMPKGEEAPAYGWGRHLDYEPGRGILCTVEWTPEGRDDIRSGRCRYLSPVIGYERETGRVRAVHSAALTTMPATPHMPELAASFNPFNSRGRDCPFGQPPAQIPASGITALGSCLR